MTAAPASVTVVSGECVATLALRGGGPSRLTWRGQELLEGYAGPDKQVTAPLSANVVLAPWPNRTRDGAFDFDGQRHRLGITEPGRATALHGFVSDREWTVVEHRADAVCLVVEPGPQPGWPWPIHLSVAYRITGRGLRANLTLRNDGTADMPAACGFHLYPSALGAPTDTCSLAVPDHLHLPLDERGLPCGEQQEDVDILPHLVNPLAGRVLDHCLWTDDPQFTLSRPDGAGVVLSTSPELRWFQIFTPDVRTGMPYPGRPGGRAVAVEPMTAPPDALNSGAGLARLPPGECLTCSWHLDVLVPH